MVPVELRRVHRRIASISVRGALCRLHQLKKDPAGVLRVNKVDAGISGAALGFWEQQPEATFPQDGTHMVQVMDAIGELLDARAAVAVKPLGDSGVLVEGGQELDLGVLFSLSPGADHGLGDALLLIDLPVQLSPTEDLGVELDGLIKVPDRQAA